MNNIKRISFPLNLVISITAVFIVISRFAYIFYIGDNDVEGDFLDFQQLSTFLYTCGVEVSYLSFAFILAYATRFMEKNAKKPFLFLSYVISFVGFYFISWILLDEGVYNTKEELLICFLASIGIIITIYILSKFIKENYNSTAKLKSKIRFVMNKMIVESVENNHVVNKERWENEIVNFTLNKVGVNNKKRKPLSFKWVVGVAIIFIVVARFAYVFHLEDNDVEGDFFDFRWLSIFLYACGVEVSYLSFALILAYITKFMEEKTKKPFLILAYVIAFIGLYFISWILLEEKAYNTKEELIINFIVATIIIITVFVFSTYMGDNYESIEKLKSKIRFVMYKLIVESVKNKHVTNKERWKEEIINPTLEKLDE